MSLTDTSAWVAWSVLKVSVVSCVPIVRLDLGVTLTVAVPPRREGQAVAGRDFEGGVCRQGDRDGGIARVLDVHRLGGRGEALRLFAEIQAGWIGGDGVGG